MNNRTRSLIYYVAIAALFTHELDAVLYMEWRLLYHLRTLPDLTASSAFVALHLPIFFGFLYFGHHPNATVKKRFRALVAGLLVFHGVLHFRLSGSEPYLFVNWWSNLYIYMAAGLGVVYLLTGKVKADN